jgi:glycosyltransferase involved in cell wall biosynthesis
MDNRFVILITQRDAVPFIRRCINSVIEQTYKNYEVIIMDDNSTDGTWEIIQKEYSQFQAIHTPKQDYHIKNFIAGINLTATDGRDIIVFLSGDDYLYGNDVLKYLNEIYTPDIWFTYGNFIRTSGLHGKGCFPITEPALYRRSGLWFASHLVTCRKKLFDAIKKEDLLYMNGEYPNNSFDSAMIYPMVEMCGVKHMRFIDKVLYVYNDQNPVAHAHYLEDKKACLRERKFWVAKPSYKELTEL